MNPSTFIFGGQAAFSAASAAQVIAEAADARSLATGLLSVQEGLAPLTREHPALDELGTAIGLYAGTLSEEDSDRAASARESLAQVVGHLPPEAWRAAIRPHLGPRDSRLAYLYDVQSLMKRMMRDRAYVSRVADEDKTYLRGALGELSAFLETADEQADDLIAGMAEEIASQMQSQAFRVMAEILEPSSAEATPPVPIAVPETDRDGAEESQGPGFPERWNAVWGDLSPATFPEAVSRFNSRLTDLEREVAACSAHESLDLDGLKRAEARLSEIIPEIQVLEKAREVLEDEALGTTNYPDDVVERCDGFLGRVIVLQSSAGATLPKIVEAAARKETSDEWREQHRRAAEKAEAACEELRRFFAEADLASLPGTLDERLERIALAMTAAEYAALYAEVAGIMSQAQLRSRTLEQKAEEHRRWFDKMPLSLATNGLAVLVREFRRLDDEIRAATALIARELPPRRQLLTEAESLLPVPPPGARPESRPFSLRSFQIEADTPREIVEILTRIPPDLYEKANSYLELTLLCPDHEVYRRLFEVARLARLHGGRGQYVEYREQGVLRRGYVASSILKGLVQSRKVVDDKGVERTVDESRIRYSLNLREVDLEEWERDLRSPSQYHLHKFRHFLSLLDMSNGSRETHIEHFKSDHMNKAPEELCDLRRSLLDTAYADIDLWTTLERALDERVPRAKMQQRVKRFFDQDKSLRSQYRALGFRVVGWDIPAGEMPFYYVYAFFGMRGRDEEDQNTFVASHIGGIPIERVAPDLARAGWGRTVMEAWSSEAGGVEPRTWTDRLGRAQVFSTPDRSHLLLSETMIRTAQHYLSQRFPGKTKFYDELTGEPISLTTGGRGYTLRPVAEAPADSWHSVFAARIALLAERKSPALDLLNAVYDLRNRPGMMPLWSEVVALVIQDTGPEDKTGDEIRARLGLWATARKTKLRKESKIFATFPRNLRS